MQNTSPPPRDPKAKRRALLRAFNGVMLTTPLGGLFGAALGAVFATLMFPNWDSAGGLFNSAFVGAVFGVPPGLFAGFLMGTTMAVREPDRRWETSVGMGIGIGVLYSLPFWWIGPLVALCIIFSGVLGGLGLSMLLRWIRGRWSWWSRWEERED